MAESISYKANVKDRVKQLEAKTDKIPTLSKNSSTLYANLSKPLTKMASNKTTNVSPVDSGSVDNSAAVMDVEITQLNSPQSPETSIPKVAINGNNPDSDGDTEMEPPISVKSLLRRFSSGMTHTFRKKSPDGEVDGNTQHGSKTLAVPGSSGVVDLEDSIENNSTKEVLRRSKSVSHPKTTKKPIDISKYFEKPENKQNKKTPSPIKNETKPDTSSSSAQIQQPQPQNQSPQASNTISKSGTQNSVGLKKLLHFPKKSNQQNQNQESEDKMPSPPLKKEDTDAMNSISEPRPPTPSKKSVIPVAGTDEKPPLSRDEEINNNSIESPKPKPRVKPVITAETCKDQTEQQTKDGSRNSLATISDTILVVGPNRGGKSSVVNYLLHQDLSTVYKSTPPSEREIVECIAKTSTGPQSDDASSLILIDIPGFRGDVFDASMWSTLTSHLNGSNSSMSTPLDVKQPVLIIVVVQVDESGNFVGSDEFPNFFKLLSHYWLNAFMSFPKILGVISHSFPLDSLKGKEALQQLSNMTKQYFSMRVCFHRIIHKGKQNPHQSLASTYPDLLAGLRTFLEGKTQNKQQDSEHQNLSNSTVLKTIFGPTYPKTLVECFLSKRIPMKSLEHPETLKTHKILQNLYLNVIIEPTEIATLLEIGWENVNSALRKKYPSALLTLQQVIQRCGIKTFSTLPEKPLQVFDLLKHIPQHNPAITDLLTETLQFKIPSCYSALYIGQGYDLSKDAITHVSPFQFSGILKTSPIGLIPDEISCKLTEEREIVFKFYSTLEEYALDRFKDLGIKDVTFPESGAVSLSPFSSTQRYRIGYNIVKQPVPEPTKTTTSTANVEYRTFQLSLSRGGGCSEDIEFKRQFWDSLSSLPELDVKNSETVESWSDFFKYWGTHVVKAAYGGGSIQVSFRGKVLSKIYKSLGSKSKTEVLTDELETTRVFQWLTGDGLDFARPQVAKTEFMQGIDVDTSFTGGDMKFQQIDLTKLPHEGVAGSTREEWIQSLAINPVILETNLVLVPLSYFVREKSEGLATKMDVAFIHFYSNFMALQAKQSACSIL